MVLLRGHGRCDLNLVSRRNRSDVCYLVRPDVRDPSLSHVASESDWVRVVRRIDRYFIVIRRTNASDPGSLSPGMSW